MLDLKVSNAKSEYTIIKVVRDWVSGLEKLNAVFI